MTDAAPANQTPQTPTPTPAPSSAVMDAMTPAPSPSPTPTPTPTDRWQDKWLPADLRADETLATYKDPESAFRALVETKAWARGRVAIPAAGDEAAFAEFASKIRPEKAEDYKLGDDKGQATPLAEAFRKTFHDIGLHPVQAEKLNAAWNQHQADLISQQQQAGKDALMAVEMEYGTSGYNQRLTAVEATLRNLGIEANDLLPALEQAYGTDKAIRAMFKLAEVTGELGKVDGDTVALRMGRMTKAEAQAELDRQNASSDKEMQAKLADPKSPEYALRRKLMERLAQPN